MPQQRADTATHLDQRNDTEIASCSGLPGLQVALSSGECGQLQIRHLEIVLRRVLRRRRNVADDESRHLLETLSTLIFSNARSTAPQPGNRAIAVSASPSSAVPTVEGILVRCTRKWADVLKSWRSAFQRQSARWRRTKSSGSQSGSGR